LSLTSNAFVTVDEGAIVFAGQADQTSAATLGNQRSTRS
jgi:hypothetical protein